MNKNAKAVKIEDLPEMKVVLENIADDEYIEQIKKVFDFHGHISTGAFIGLQMYRIAKREMNLEDGETVYVMCECKNCMPDPFQILAGATIGNNKLKIYNIGKMAATFNTFGTVGDNVKGLRIILDANKMQDYPKLYNWYMNIEKVPHTDAIFDLIKAGDSVYSWEYVDVEVPPKNKKDVKLCEVCKESFISYNGSPICETCAKKKN
ncbi:formylmethanofuran dehydrogenase subunit E [Methanococcus voltae]|uniref:FmdE family protein n=1 Tax=Methanococcus voltae TaxID=2188 RepID=UPI001FD963FF|nr:FmdE family protein [Methanococcus voltae]MBP2144264.1 formylmethanofuran dehydrogenase subunit E [Methanococcus voltae]